MSSTTGLVLVLVASIGTMGYVTYRSVSTGNTTAEDVTRELQQDLSPVHVRFIVHRTEPELRQALQALDVEYRLGTPATKVALTETLCEVHVVDKSGSGLPPPDEFVASQVGECRKMVVGFKGKVVAY